MDRQFQSASSVGERFREDLRSGFPGLNTKSNPGGRSPPNLLRLSGAGFQITLLTFHHYFGVPEELSLGEDGDDGDEGDDGDGGVELLLPLLDSVPPGEFAPPVAEPGVMPKCE